MTNDKDKMRKKHERGDVADALSTTKLTKADDTTVWPPPIDLDTFVRASEKLEKWTHDAWTAAYFATEEGKPEVYGLFLARLDKTVDFLSRKDVSRCLHWAAAGKPVKHFGEGVESVYASAHHAVLDAQAHFHMIASLIKGNGDRDEELEAATRFFKEDRFFEFRWEALRVQMQHERAKVCELLSQTPQPQPAVSASKPKEGSLDAQALGLWLDDKSRTKTQLAKLLGRKHTQSLSPERCPCLNNAMRAYKAVDPSRMRIRGSKDRHGNIEATKDDEE